jgi:SAM-dependent methyltransferase
MSIVAKPWVDEAVAAGPVSQAATPTDHCPLCEFEGRSQKLSTRHPAWLRRCAGCGLVYTFPQPDDGELAAVYDADYFQTFGYGSSRGEYHRLKQAGFQRLLDVAERFVAPGRLLDVGSGLGDLLFVARSRGWDVTGLELIPFAVERADEIVPGATVCGTLDDLSEPDESFDLITCTDVLEHVRRPDRNLLRMRRLLRKGGCVLITTVNVDSWPARMLGPRWPHFHRDHLWYFHRETLNRFVEMAGFEVLHWGVPRKVFSLSYVLSIFAAYGPGTVSQRLAGSSLRCLPRSILHAHWSPLPEGQLLVARQREESS